MRISFKDIWIFCWAWLKFKTTSTIALKKKATMHLSSEWLWFEQIWLVVMNNHKHDGHLFCTHEVSGSKYLQLDIFCWKHKKNTLWSSFRVYSFAILKVSATYARSWIIKVSHRLSTSYPQHTPPFSTGVLANHYSLLWTLSNKLHCSPQTFAVHTDREVRPLSEAHWEIQKIAKLTKQKEGGGHQIKSSAYTSIYYMCNL